MVKNPLVVRAQSSLPLLALCLLAGAGLGWRTCLAGPGAQQARPGVVEARPDVRESDEPSDLVLDRFGGIVGPVSAPTGFFRVEKVGHRWMFVTPEGNPFWMLSVYVVDTFDGGTTYGDQALPAKYGAPANSFPWGKFVAQTVKRMRSWGFNTLGEYSTTYALPVATYSGSGNPEKLPFIRFINPAGASLYNQYHWSAGATKDIVGGTDPKINDWWRGAPLPDIFDPNWEDTARGYALDTRTDTWAPIFPSGSLPQMSWLIGTTADDADYLWGLKARTDPHLGWMVAATAPTQTQSFTPPLLSVVRYTDPTVYSKKAWRDYLAGKYETIEALNAAWGADYTTFDSAGGWPRHRTGGTGLMDEDGSSPWMHPSGSPADLAFLAGLPPSVVGDLNAFVGQFAQRYFSTIARYLRRASPHHLVFGPAPLFHARPEVLQAAGQHLDVAQVVIRAGELAGMESVLEQMYLELRRPMFLWLTVTACSDSPLASSSKHCETIWKDYNVATQSQRGRQYADLVNRLFHFRASDGTYPIVGIDWWEWTDKLSEGTNFGLVSSLDNAYDGKEAVVAPGVDGWGYPTGGEQRNYGDFMTAVRQTNRAIWQQLWRETQNHRKGLEFVKPVGKGRR